MCEQEFGIIGAGLIGRKRGEALRSLGIKVSAVADQDEGRAEQLAEQLGAKAMPLDALLSRPSLTAVIVATYHNSLTEISTRALECGKHVLVEKPAGIDLPRLRALRETSLATGKALAVGYNHRFHPALMKAKEIVASGELGPLLYIRAHYGHGGRLGYEKEWRSQPELSGGGELIDQGSHLIDLSCWIGGPMGLLHGYAHTFFWDMPVDDNAFLLLRSPEGNRYAHLHASCTEWKNAFSFEIFCRDGKCHITGLGRSYGAEEIKIYRMQPEMGPPPLEQISFPGDDNSWRLEMEAFLGHMAGISTEIGKIEDALHTLKIVQDTYLSSQRSAMGKGKR